ncbi:hypothetical protein Bresa_03155|uniref:Uncharacterized protein n=1 Tax=Brenneria salicis ATCC 15712 = DSM 30166 TaxID=714314 RepID=A0A366HZH6_9GAMM|nr:hypothetical protein [Brenneria salicis ATCC 15712 = DSM 30166]RBP59740.1 hypothetical protein DES54_13628 [Brenneria salicis ATCC 15712 = DSM 30166]
MSDRDAPVRARLVREPYGASEKPPGYAGGYFFISTPRIYWLSLLFSLWFLFTIRANPTLCLA